MFVSLIMMDGFDYGKIDYVDIPSFTTIEAYQQWATSYGVEIIVEDQSAKQLESYPTDYEIIKVSNNKLVFNERGIL